MRIGTENCPDPWHEDSSADHDEYEIPIPDTTFVIQGYGCRTCGFKTVTQECGYLAILGDPDAGDP